LVGHAFKFKKNGAYSLAEFDGRSLSTDIQATSTRKQST